MTSHSSAEGAEMTSHSSAEGAEYESQGQARSEASASPLGKQNEYPGSPERA